MTQKYTVDGFPIPIEMDTADAEFGPDIVLSTAKSDPTFSQDWYSQGYSVRPAFSADDFAKLRAAIHSAIGRILTEQGIDQGDTPLEQYHHLVDDAQHQKTVARTRDLFAEDFDLDIDALHKVLGDHMGFPLTDTYADRPERAHIIIRINRPGSDDFNPVHNDVYEIIDGLGHAPRMVNFWIPICGFGPQSSLPLVAGSHLIPESKVLRTRAGSSMRGKRYHVNSILSWDGDTALKRPSLQQGDALIFSSYLIHGLALNLQKDTTRIALEFRLFERDLLGKPLPDTSSP